ncbi:PadR family transcriptional regulator [Streptosporangium sp. NPDC049376]|uniref:PadR family transcriptional regulator n=1 Tax=Streptosporangium sp. NPDC049376 TaxID=3366192 RepID=UPI0037A24D99
MSLRHALLGLLSQGPASGYDLLKTFDISLANVWPATQSQVYAELGRLASTGLVEVTSEGPRGRKEYAVTEAGRAELRRWLTETDPGPLARRSEMLLRVFFLGEVSHEQAGAYLRRQAELGEERIGKLAPLREMISAMDDGLSVYGRLALEWGMRFSAMQRDWALWAEQEIERLPGDRGCERRPEPGAGQETDRT